MNRNALSPLLAMGLASALLVTCPAAAQTPGNLDIPNEEPLTAPVDTGNEDGEWREDPARVERGTLGQLPPDQYMKSLRELGVLDQLNQRGNVHLAKAGGDWELVGPIGGWGSPVRNGRIAGIQILQDGSYYRLYAGACQGGLWLMRSQYWAQWTDIGYNLPNPSVRAFAVDPDDFRHIYVATGDHRRYVGGGLFETHDEGVTWTEATMPFSYTPSYFYRLMILGNDPNTGRQRLAAVSTAGPIWSDNGGATWQRGNNLSDEPLRYYWTDMVKHPTDRWLWAVCASNSDTGYSGVYVSGDYGEHWAPYSSPVLPPSEEWSRASMAISGSNPNRLVVMISDDNYLRGVYRTDDMGSTWTDITQGMVNTGNPDESFGGSQVFHAQAVVINPADEDHIIIGAVHMAESKNGGADWIGGEFWTGIQEGHVDFTQLYFSDVTGDDIMWMCNDGGIYYHRFSTETTYSAIGDHTTGLACSEINYMDAERDVVAIGLQDNGTFLSIDGGADWEYVEGADGAEVEVFDALGGGIYYNNGVWSQSPEWRTYKYYYGGSKEYMENPDVYMPRLYFSPFTGRMYTHDDTGIYRKMAEEPAGWNFQYNGWQTDLYSIRGIWGSWGRDDALWLTYRNDESSPEGNEDLTYAYFNGTSWSAKHWEDFNSSGKDVLCVTPSREWPDEAWVGVSGYLGAAKIWHLREGGDIREDITSNLHQVSNVLSIEVMPFNPDVIWAGTDLGVYQTTNGGANWEPFVDGLPIGRCIELHLVADPAHSGTSTLYLAMDGRGLWKREIAMPPIIYVDSRYTTSGDGTIWGGAYRTVAEAIAVAPDGAIIAVHADDYAEPQRLSRDVRVVTWQGDSRIH